MEQQRLLVEALCTNFMRQLSDLPLCLLAQPLGKEVSEFSGVHGYYELGSGGVGKDITSVFFWYSCRYKFVVQVCYVVPVQVVAKLF